VREKERSIAHALFNEKKHGKVESAYILVVVYSRTFFYIKLYIKHTIGCNRKQSKFPPLLFFFFFENMTNVEWNQWSLKILGKLPIPIP
jgi:hypothetical protein